MAMLERDPTYDEQSTKLAAPISFLSWDREALALKIQTIDGGCTRTEARCQIDDMALSFSLLARPPCANRPCHPKAPRTATLSKLWHCLARTNLLPILERGT